MIRGMSSGSDELQEWFDAHQGRLIDKWHHYFEAYDKHFSRFQGKEVVVLEIGISHGGSIQMWQEYFGPGLRYFGIDIDPRCTAYAEPGVEIFIGSQSDPAFLREVAASIPDVDILIDDGGHTMRQQLVTLDVLYDTVKDTGVYMAEDLHTSYWAIFGGGHRRRGTFIEHCKGLIDSLNGFHSEQSGFAPNNFTRTATSLHFYDSMVFIEKHPRVAPTTGRHGKPSFENTPVTTSTRTRLKRRGLHELNRGLRAVRIRDFTTP